MAWQFVRKRATFPGSRSGQGRSGRHRPVVGARLASIEKANGAGSLPRSMHGQHNSPGSPWQRREEECGFFCPQEHRQLR
jgi:hypothetical protein